MTPQPLKPDQASETSSFWQPKTIEAFDKLCMDNDFNPVRLRRLIDHYIATNQKPSRQQLIEALKHKPRIQARAAVLGSITKKLYAFIDTFTPTT